MSRDASDLLAELVAADLRIKELETENQRLREAVGLQWISVDDRLPVDGEWCWVDGDRFLGPFLAMWSKPSDLWTNEDTWEDFEHHVERWCPIPKPPSSGEVVR